MMWYAYHIYKTLCICYIILQLDDPIVDRQTYTLSSFERHIGTNETVWTKNTDANMTIEYYNDICCINNHIVVTNMATSIVKGTYATNILSIVFYMYI